MMLLVTLSLVALLGATVWLYNKHCLSYWAKRSIPSPPAIPFLGNLDKVFFQKRQKWIIDNEVYQSYSKDGLGGTYSFLKPVLHISDPELIKRVLVKDFDYFAERRSFASPNENDRPMNKMLISVNGDEWKTLRSIMTPTFTSGKMRNMFRLVCDKADALVAFTLAEATKKASVNMKFNFGRFTIDTIASCAFGLECNSLVEDAVFPKMADLFFSLGFCKLVKLMTLINVPKIFKFFGWQLSSGEIGFFRNVAEEALAARRKGTRRRDFLDLLLEAQVTEDTKDKSNKKVMDDLTIISQSILFIIVGYDTTATTLAFASHLLSKNPDKQQRLRQELQDMVRENNGITYQGIMEAKYLDACLLETLRIYPPASLLERICSKDYQIPGTSVVVKKGQTIQVPVWAIHHDEKYWPEPEVFLPDRFLPENKGEITPHTHLPFGLGPRNCIAMRFALMEAKVALAKMILAAEMRPAPGCEELTMVTGVMLMKPNEVNLILDPLKQESPPFSTEDQRATC